MNKKYIIAAIILIGIGTLIFAARKNSSSSSSLPAQVVLQVPFTPQAPTDKWDRNEDCEETSITMANAFLSGNTSNTLAEGESIKSRI